MNSKILGGFMKKRFLILVTCLALISSIPVQAEIQSNSQTYVVLDMNNNYYASQPQYHWEEIDGNWYYKNEAGEVKYGKFYDEFGDIYDTGNNADGKIIVSGTNSHGERFDENGRLMNQAMTGHERYHDMALEYEEGKALKFNDVNDFRDFIEYYQIQYSLYNLDVPFTLYNNTMTSTIGNNAYDRSSIVTQVRNKFGTLEGSNEYEKIYDACERIRTTLDYDVSYAHESLQKCLDSNIGVCWHYAKIVSILLDDAGIYNELVFGKYGESTNYHMWLRCKVDGKWIYTDPTLYKSSGWSFYNINYDLYADEYDSLLRIRL